MGIEDNKAIVRRFFEACDRHELDEAAQFFAPDYIDHFGPVDAPPATGGGTFKQFYGMLLQAFPDWRQNLEGQIAEGDLVVSRKTYRGTHRGEFRGVPPRGKQVAILAIDIFRVADGRLAEHWGLGDVSGLMQQLMPPSESEK